MQFEQYKEMDGPLVRDRDIPCARGVRKDGETWRGSWGKKGIARHCGTW